MMHAAVPDFQPSRSNVIHVDFRPQRVPLPLDRGLEILSCGAGMQSTALALLSCENKIKGHIHKHVPIYDAILFCDLGAEPSHVYSQVRFLQDACRFAKIPFFVLEAPLYQDYMDNFGKRRVVSVPFWTVGEDGKKGKMPRMCTIDYKIVRMQNYIRWNILGYKKGEKTREWDKKRHKMHLGFSMEEERRCKPNSHKLFQNEYPLVKMKWTRADSYAYCRDVWGLETEASACLFCPFHTNHFFWKLKAQHPAEYEQAVAFDELLEHGQKTSLIKSKLYISRSRKRVWELNEGDCGDVELFPYRDLMVASGF